MKILIVGTSRSGTTSLIQGISSQNFKSISEPFNDRFRDEQLDVSKYLNYERLCVKSLVFQKPNDYKDTILFYKEFCKRFDKIILLDRESYKEHWISNINLHYKNKLKENLNLTTWPSHHIWYKDEITSEIENEVINEGWFEFFKNEKKLIKILSDELNIKITLYENLYGNDRSISMDIINNWNINVDSKKLNEYLNPKYKYMRDTKKPI